MKIRIGTDTIFPQLSLFTNKELVAKSKIIDYKIDDLTFFF